MKFARLKKTRKLSVERYGIVGPVPVISSCCKASEELERRSGEDGSLNPDTIK